MHATQHLDSQTQPRGNQKTKRGFTLVELMVVVVILGALVALVGPNVWSLLFEAKEGIAKTQMSQFGQSIDTYRLRHKELPNSLEALTETNDRNPHPILEKVPMDPWGEEYSYRKVSKSEYKIRSGGEDKQLDTDDDIVYPEDEKRRGR